MRTRLMIASAATAALLAGAAFAQNAPASDTAVNPPSASPQPSVNDGVTWTDPANWAGPGGFPSGPLGVATFNADSGGPLVRLGSNITMSRINFYDPSFAQIAQVLPVGTTPTITMTGQARIDGGNLPPIRLRLGDEECSIFARAKAEFLPRDDPVEPETTVGVGAHRRPLLPKMILQ